MAVLIAVLATVAVVLPLVWARRLARLDEPSRSRWLVKAADIAAFLALLVARWDILGFHTRTAILVPIAVATAWSWRRHARRPWRSDAPWPRADRWSTLGSLALMLGLAGCEISGLLPPGPAVPLGCPLAGGTFVVGQGGGNRLLNHHTGRPEQTHAADILALGPWGFRATGPLPRDLRRYAAFHAAVTSPCDGRVVATRDGLPDLAPPRADPENPAGNHVVLACGLVRVELAHLAAGTVAVAPGDAIVAGDVVARVGNSGNATEPHLHIHAVDAGTGRPVPITPPGRRLTAGSMGPALTRRRRVDLPAARHRRLRRQLLALAGAPRGQLDLAGGEPARADGDPPGQADQVHRRELRPGPLVAVVVERVEPGRRQPGIERLAGGVRRGVALLEVDDADAERRHPLGPDDALVVVARLDDRPDQPRDADAVASPCAPAPARRPR